MEALVNTPSIPLLEVLFEYSPSFSGKYLFNGKELNGGITKRKINKEEVFDTEKMLTDGVAGLISGGILN